MKSLIFQWVLCLCKPIPLITCFVLEDLSERGFSLHVRQDCHSVLFQIPNLGLWFLLIKAFSVPYMFFLSFSLLLYSNLLCLQRQEYLWNLKTPTNLKSLIASNFDAFLVFERIFQKCIDSEMDQLIFLLTQLNR